MKTIAKSACLFLVVIWAGSAVGVAQTTPPAKPTTNTSNLPKRFSGKIDSVNATNKTIVLQGNPKVEIFLTDKTKIVKAKAPAEFEALAVGQMVIGIYRKDGAGKWAAETLNVGDLRQPVRESVPKTTFVAPDKPK